LHRDFLVCTSAIAACATLTTNRRNIPKTSAALALRTRLRSSSSDTSSDMFKILRADFQADLRTNANNSLRRALSESVVNNVYHWTPQACSATPSVAMSSNDCG